MPSFYGNTRMELLEGFSNIIEQDSVWDDTRESFNSIRLTKKKSSRFLGVLEPLYIGHDLGLYSGTYKFSAASGLKNYNVNIFKLKTDYIEVSGSTKPKLLISHEISLAADEIDYILDSRTDITSLALYQIKNTTDYFFALGQQPTVVDWDVDLLGQPKFEFLSFGPSMISNTEASKFFIDNQGHLGQPHLTLCQIKKFNLNLNNYTNDKYVNYMCCGPESPTGPKDEDHFYLADNLKLLNSTYQSIQDEEGNNIITTDYGNIIDLYTQVAPLYNLFVAKEPLSGMDATAGFDVIDDCIKKYNDINEKMNGLDLLIQNDSKTNFYNFKSTDTLYNSTSEITKFTSILDSLDYTINNNSIDKFQIPNTAPPTKFLTTINKLRHLTADLKNTTLFKTVEHIEEFYNTIILFIFGFKPKINNIKKSLLDPIQEIYIPKEIKNKSGETINTVELLNQHWAYFKLATEYDEDKIYFEKNNKGKYVRAEINEALFEVNPNTYYIYIEELPENFSNDFINNKKNIFGNQLAFVLFLLWKWQMDLQYQDVF